MKRTIYRVTGLVILVAVLLSLVVACKQSEEPTATEPPATTESDNQDAIDHLKQGLDYQGQGQLDLAIEEYTQAIELDPQLIGAYTIRGDAYAQKDDYDQAIADYSRAIELDPQFAMAYGGRGLAYTLVGEQEKAILDLERALELGLSPDQKQIAEDVLKRLLAESSKDVGPDPEPPANIGSGNQDATDYHNQGLKYYRRQQWDLAIEEYTQAIELDPQFVGAFYSRGEAYLVQGDEDQALADFTQVIELSPQYTKAYYYRALIYAFTGDYEQAIADYSQAIELYPQFAAAYSARGTIYVEIGEREKAISDLEKALELGLESELERIVRSLLSDLED